MKSSTRLLLQPAQLRAARALLDWSRGQCGKYVGISAETVKNIEHGHYAPTEATLEKILTVFSDHGVEFFSQHGVSLKESPERLAADAQDDDAQDDGETQAEKI